MPLGPAVRSHRLRPAVETRAVVERPRVVRAIDEASSRGVLVLSAPVGFGATTAVAQALGDRTDVGWVSLEAIDADPEALVVQVAQAVRTATGGRWRPRPWASPVDLAAATVEAADRFAVAGLVLDGVDARAHAGASEVIGYLVENLPRSTRLVITTHDDVLTLPVRSLRGRLEVLDEHDLALAPDEATQLVVDTCPHLPADVVDQLVETADGWTAVLREAVLHVAARPHEDAVEWLRSTGVDHVARAALATTTEMGAALLLESSLLDELSVPLCDAVIGWSDSSYALDDLARFGSLVRRQPEGTRTDGIAGAFWVRQPLLTAGLRRRAFSREATEAHRRAAVWYRDNGGLDGAMNHYVAAGAFEEAGELLSLHEDALYAAGDVVRAASWYASLPPEAWGERGWHLLRTAWGRAFTRDVRGAELTVEQLRGHLASAPATAPEEATLHGEAELVAAYLSSMRGDVDATIARAARAVDLIDGGPTVNSTQLAPILLVRALLWRGDGAAARRQLARIEHQSFPTDLMREAALGAQQARCLVDEGEIARGAQVARQASRWLASQQLDPVGVSQFGLLTAEAAAETEAGRPRDAVPRFASAADAAVDRGYVGDAVDALRWQARAQVALGDLGGALSSVGRARVLLAEHAPTSSLSGPLDLQEAWARSLAGDVVRAERLVQGLPRSDERSLMWARLTLRRQGSRALATLAEAACATPRLAAERQVLLATAAVRRSTRLAETHLLQGADLAARHGWGLLLLGADDDLLDLATVVGLRTGHDALVALAEAARTGFGAAPVPAAVPVGGAAPRVLSAGEIQLLALLPRRDSNADIAAQLGVSVNTVKTRLARLYRKLGASSRDEAIAVARRRGLLT